MGDKLPDNVVSITALTINRNKRKNCECYNSYPKKRPAYEIDAVNKEITCRYCGVVIDPFDALLHISNEWEFVEEDTKRLLEQRKEIVNYKPWLLIIRNLEKECRGGSMIPSCPHCHKGILFEEFSGFTNKEMELQRRKFRLEKE